MHWILGVGLYGVFPNLGIMPGLYRGNGNEHGNYSLGFRATSPSNEESRGQENGKIKWKLGFRLGFIGFRISRN